MSKSIAENLQEYIETQGGAVGLRAEFAREILAELKRMSSELDELKSKLAEMGGDSNEAFPFIPWSKEDEFFASQPIANNSEPVQRITEQDAREIAEEYTYWASHESFRDYSVEQFFKEGAGKTLLAKLNEHREPEVKAVQARYLTNTHEYVGSRTTFIVDNERPDGFDENNGDYCILYTSQVTPNKAEVPTHYYAKNSDVWWYRKSDNDIYYWDLTDEDNRVYGWIKHSQGRDINHDKWLEENLKPLPPLKGE